MDSLVFLDDEQLQELTGYKHRSLQIEWLSQNGYLFDVRGDGRPNVLIEQVRRRQLVDRQVETRSKPGPDFAWLN